MPSACATVAMLLELTITPAARAIGCWAAGSHPAAPKLPAAAALPTRRRAWPTGCTSSAPGASTSTRTSERAGGAGTLASSRPRNAPHVWCRRALGKDPIRPALRVQQRAPNGGAPPQAACTIVSTLACRCRGYRNPEFFAKMVEHLEIDQYGTSFAPDVSPPLSLSPPSRCQYVLLARAHTTRLAGQSGGRADRTLRV